MVLHLVKQEVHLEMRILSRLVCHSVIHSTSCMDSFHQGQDPGAFVGNNSTITQHQEQLVYDDVLSR
jgi:hypothetical protein